MSKTRASCFITGSRHLESDESNRPSAHGLVLSSVSRRLEPVMKHSPSFLTYYMVKPPLHLLFYGNLSLTLTKRRFSAPRPVLQAPPNQRANKVVAIFARKTALCIVRLRYHVGAAGFNSICWSWNSWTHYN